MVTLFNFNGLCPLSYLCKNEKQICCVLFLSVYAGANVYLLKKELCIGVSSIGEFKNPMY